MRQDQPEDSHWKNRDVNRQVSREVARAEQVEKERLDEQHVVRVHRHKLRLPIAASQQTEEVLAHSHHEDRQTDPPVENAPPAERAGGPDAKQVKQREEEKALRTPIVK